MLPKSESRGPDALPSDLPRCRLHAFRYGTGMTMSKVENRAALPFRIALAIAIGAVASAGCAAHEEVPKPGRELVDVDAVVEDVCAACDMVDASGGGAVEWDVVRVRVRSPGAYAGRAIAVRVLIGQAEAEQRKKYAIASRIAFVAPEAALEQGKVMLNETDISADRSE